MKAALATIVTLLTLLPSAVTDADEAEVIKKLVFEAQRAGFDGRDLDRYMSQWAKDARIVIGRSPKAGMYDLTLNQRQIRGCGTLKLRDESRPPRRIQHENVVVEVSGEHAILRVRTILRGDDGLQEVGETFLLRKTAGGWKVTENRCWPIRAVYGEQTIIYDKDYWKARDAQVDLLRREGNLRELAAALLWASRYVEARVVARDLTRDGTAEASDWIMRAHIARIMGDVADAVSSFRKALELDPAAAVPSYIRKQKAEESTKRAFYVPENPAYTITDSVRDSIRFTLTKTLKRDKRGHLASISSFVDPEGKVMGWHDFGNLEGPGWAANAVGGAYEIYTLGKFLGKPDWQEKAVGILDHVLEGGFIDEDTGFIRGYRETTTDKFCLNYTHNSKWFCPGSMAKVAFQLLIFADELGDDRSGQGDCAKRMRTIATRCAKWIDERVEKVPNGWFPRRTTPDGKLYRKSPTGGDDPFWQTSADGLFIVQLQAALTQRGLADYRQQLKEKVDVFIRAGGIFGSINHDTYDPHENVAYSVAFRTLLLTSSVLDDRAIRDFAYEKCLAGLEQFKMCEDRNGVATKGLLYMEKSWDTSYLWENAEAALAYFEAAADIRHTDPARSREYELDGLVILRAAAKHHHGPHGFLTEGVDWNNHVGQQHHIGQAEFAAIQYTEPFLNNQHIAEPTLYYLMHHAEKSRQADAAKWQDVEENVILKRPTVSEDSKSAE